MTKAKQTHKPETGYPAWYAQWVANYIATFGKVHDDNLLSAMPLWFTGFRIMNVTREELDAVTIRMVSGSEPLPAFPSDHLDRIKLEIHNLRTERKRAEEKERIKNITTEPALSASVWAEAVNRSAKNGNSVALSLLNKGN
jgi:hypothetical protein